MSAKHTRGPLNVLQNSKERPTQFLIVAKNKGSSGKFPALALVGKEADADLFAAAPDLLATLKDLIADAQGKFGTSVCVDAIVAANAAIAKAEGRS